MRRRARVVHGGVRTGPRCAGGRWPIADARSTFGCVRRDSGFPSADAQDDFQRARRRQVMSQLAPPARARLARRRRDPAVRGGRRRARARRGALRRPADDRARLDPRDRRPRPGGFDRQFRPTTARGARALGADRQRRAPRRGAAADLRLPHRRRALRPRRPPPRVGRPRARPRRRSTRTWSRSSRGSAPSARCVIGDLPLKSHERLFHERVPLPAARPRAHLAHRPVALRVLAEGVEAWGFRAMQDRAEFIDRRTAARGCGSRRTTCPIVDMLPTRA